jgi:squalene synthase HpnC
MADQMSDVSFQSDLELYGPEQQRAQTPTLAEAQRYCRRLTRRHYENFTVGGLVLPRPARGHVANVYAYCRWADNLADETGDPQQSLALLDWWQSELNGCYEGRARHPVFVALADTIRRYDISREPLADLLVAFRQDQTVTRYETFEDLLGYCRNSANPVGRIVLSLAESHKSDRIALSDSICTGLQLANFWQDVARDWRMGRVYLPQEDCRQFGVDETTLADGRCSETFRNLLAFEVKRAQEYLRRGLPLIARMPRPWQLTIALFIHGGLKILEAIRRQDYDVLGRRPAVSKLDKLRLIAGCWWRLRRGRFGEALE